MANLGYHLGGLGDAWCIPVEIDGKTIHVAFRKGQAIEIARRITEHYTKPPAIVETYTVNGRMVELRDGAIVSLTITT
jgi:hypothetical protein